MFSLLESTSELQRGETTLYAERDLAAGKVILMAAIYRIFLLMFVNIGRQVRLIPDRKQLRISSSAGYISTWTTIEVHLFLKHIFGYERVCERDDVEDHALPSDR